MSNKHLEDILVWIMLLKVSLMVAARILPIDFLHFINGDQKGLAEGSGNPFFCILSHEKIGAEGEGRVMSP